jgi:hypothetical protein
MNEQRRLLTRWGIARMRALLLACAAILSVQSQAQQQPVSEAEARRNVRELQDQGRRLERERLARESRELRANARAANVGPQSTAAEATQGRKAKGRDNGEARDKAGRKRDRGIIVGVPVKPGDATKGSSGKRTRAKKNPD